MMTKRALLKIKGLSETKVDKIKEAVSKCQVSHDPVSFDIHLGFFSMLKKKLISILSRKRVQVL
jgi:hypothetical protein